MKPLALCTVAGWVAGTRTWPPRPPRSATSGTPLGAGTIRSAGMSATEAPCEPPAAVAVPARPGMAVSPAPPDAGAAVEEERLPPLPEAPKAAFPGTDRPEASAAAVFMGTPDGVLVVALPAVTAPARVPASTTPGVCAAVARASEASASCICLSWLADSEGSAATMSAGRSRAASGAASRPPA